MAPKIIGGSNYDNPYAKPLDFMPKSPQQKLQDKTFDAFDQGQRESQIKEDPVATVKAEFEEAQRRQRQPKPRKGVQT